MHTAQTRRFPSENYGDDKGEKDEKSLRIKLHISLFLSFLRSRKGGKQREDPAKSTTLCI
jgi:hypothetical protein